MRIAIIGLGLMGGSIAKALKEKSSKTVLSTLYREQENTSLMDHVFKNLEELMQNSDLIILATPLPSILLLTDEIFKKKDILLQKLIVMDIGSVKGPIAKKFEEYTSQNLEFVATHPMAGLEKSGFANSKSDLFQSASWVITPHEKNNETTLELIAKLIEELKAKPLLLDAKEHDSQAALISHLPYLLSSSYLEFVENVKPESLKIAGPGFKSFTRLGMDNKALHQEIKEQNQEEIVKLLQEWLAHLKNRENIV